MWKKFKQYKNKKQKIFTSHYAILIYVHIFPLTLIVIFFLLYPKLYVLFCTIMKKIKINSGYLLVNSHKMALGSPAGVKTGLQQRHTENSQIKSKSKFYDTQSKCCIVICFHIIIIGCGIPSAIFIEYFHFKQTLHISYYYYQLVFLNQV